MRWRRTTFETLSGESYSPPDDGVLIANDGNVCARVHLTHSLPGAPKWFWGWQRDPCDAGYADTKDEAKAECERRAREAGLA